MLHVIAKSLVPIFFVMALGYLAGRRRIIDNRNVGQLNALVMDFALPASLFVATASTPRRVMTEQGWLFAIQSVAMLAMYLLWFAHRRHAATASRAEVAIEAVTVALPNYAAAGLPIVSALLGPQDTVQVAVAIAASSFVLSPPTLVLVELSAQKPARVGRALRHAVTKPIVVAPVLGTVVSFSGVHLGPVAVASLELVGQATGGVALFLTGLVLSGQPFRLNRNVLVAIAASNVIRPLLVIAIVYVVPVPFAIGRMSILLAALPSGFFGILFAASYRVDARDAGPIVLASTVLGIFTLAIAIAVFFPS